MAEKAKFDREAAFKSIIGAGRQSENTVVAEEKNEIQNVKSPNVKRFDGEYSKIHKKYALKIKALQEKYNYLFD